MSTKYQWLLFSSFPAPYFNLIAWIEQDLDFLNLHHLCYAILHSLPLLISEGFKISGAHIIEIQLAEKMIGQPLPPLYMRSMVCYLHPTFRHMASENILGSFFLLGSASEPQL